VSQGALNKIPLSLYHEEELGVCRLQSKRDLVLGQGGNWKAESLRRDEG